MDSFIEREFKLPNWKSRLKRRHPFKSRVFWVLAGAVGLGVVVPCVLTWWHLGTIEIAPNTPRPIRPPWNLDQLFSLMLLAGFFCGPGAVVLSGVLLGIMRRAGVIEGPDEKWTLLMGAGLGALISFGNFPGYLVLEILNNDWVRFVALFVVTGGTCGSWIGWQAYKEWHPERGFFPRFSLQTLMLLAFAWGLLAFLFQPLQV